jgi:hypothetical protein
VLQDACASVSPSEMGFAWLALWLGWDNPRARVCCYQPHSYLGFGETGSGSVGT